MREKIARVKEEVAYPGNQDLLKMNRIPPIGEPLLNLFKRSICITTN